MPGASGSADLETSGEKRQQQSDENDHSQQSKTVHEGEHRRLLRHNVRDESVGLMDRVWCCSSARHEKMARSVDELADRAISIRKVADQDALVILRAPFQHRGNEGDAETSAPVTAKIHQTGSFVVFVLR